MTGSIVLQGGGPFTLHDELDAEVLRGAGAARGGAPVVVLPTADAFEHPERLAAAAGAWGARLGVDVVPLMVLRRADALEPAAVDAIGTAAAVYLVGDQPLHLRSVLKDTPLWAAIAAVVDRGGVVAGVGASAAAMCDPMVDPRGGAFTLGLGLVGGLALVTEVEGWSSERLHRTLGLADTTVACLASTAALVRGPRGWSTRGDCELHGELP